MTPQEISQHNWLAIIQAGGLVMVPLVLCSLIVWAVILERLWRFRKLGAGLRSFHLEASNLLLRNEVVQVKELCKQHSELPTARLLHTALERLGAKDQRLQSRWQEAIERRRLEVNQDLRRYLWLLGTIGSASPFIGLFGTVVGILRSFSDIARTGSGGFAVVAAGISESLIATAAGIVVAVVAVMAYNAFQVKWNGLVLLIKLQIEELSEILEASFPHNGT